MVTDPVLRIQEKENNLLEVNFQAYASEFTADVQEERAHSVIQSLGHTTSLLPPVVRWISPSKRSIILERSPQVMPMRFYGVPQSDVDRAREQNYDLPLPWMLYGILLDAQNYPQRVYTFVIPGPLEDANQELSLLPLTNMYLNGKYCLPDESYDNKEKVISLAEGINKGFMAIWQTNFNLDVTHAVMRSYSLEMPNPLFVGKNNARKSAASILARWSKFSIDDVLGWEWAPALRQEDKDDVMRFNDLRSQLASEDMSMFTGPYIMNTMWQLLQSQKT